VKQVPRAPRIHAQQHARRAGELLFRETPNYRLSAHRHKPDLGLLTLIAILLVSGLIVIYAIGPALSYQDGKVNEHYYLIRQLAHIGLGVAAFVFAALTPLSVWRRLTKTIAMAAIGANLALLVPGLGLTVNGATRWINLGGFTSFQPAELLKLAIILVLADQLAARNQTERDDAQMTLKPIFWLLGVSGIMVVVLQKDMGTMGVIAGLIFAVLFTAGLSWRRLGTLASTMAAAGVAAIILFPHRVERLLTFLRPETDVQNTSYHINQALIAVGSGGLFGLGLGKSLQVYGYLPIAASDSIFAIYAEKFGFVGASTLVILYGLLIWRLLRTTTHAPDTYTQLITAGVMVWFTTHVLINIGAMLALIPLTGVTLPLLSIGGTSLVFLMFGLGLVFQVSFYSHYRVDAAFLKPLNQQVRSSS
jgi:cell division protein FtsW